MFKASPFKKVKEGSKNIVGRVVEVNGKEIDENYNLDNKSTSSTSVQKSTISSSVSRLFGASPYKKSSTTRTPGRKLLKKLICTPGKSRSFPDTSVSDIDDFGLYIPNNDSAGLTVSRSNSSEEAKDLGQAPSSPPRVPSKVLMEAEKQTMRSPVKTQNHKTYSANKSNSVDEALVAASNSLDLDEDKIFTTNSSDDDDEIDHRNESESNPMSRNNYSSSSPFSSPRQHTTPSKVSHVAMKSPGIAIPTPAPSRPTSITDHLFPHPIRNMQESPMDMNANTPSPRNLSTQFEEDDDAFLPDDFVAPEKPIEDKATFTVEEVEQKIREAKREERMSLRKEHDMHMKEREKEFDQVMFDTGSQWKREADEQETKYAQLLKDERHKTSLKHHELINKTQHLEQREETLKELQAQHEALKQRVGDIESNEEKISDTASKAQEIESLKRDKLKAEKRISELVSELEEVVDPLRQQKQFADQKAAELSEQLQVLTESRDLSQNQLEESLGKVVRLEEKLAELSFVDPEEIRTSKLELENLRNLRAEDGKEIQALQYQLSQIVNEHRDLLSPKKKGSNSSSVESTCVGEIDTLRVDYDKAQDQLKSMGRVLKRYRTERDDLRATIEELQEGHVQAIEIAVKQATKDQREKVLKLSEENGALRQQPKDIAEQMLDETKKHMEELKISHKEEILRLQKSLNDEIRNSEEQQKKLESKFEMERNDLKMRHETKIESLMQDMQELRLSKTDELSIAKSSSMEEIDSLQFQLRQLKTEFEKEKNEIIKNKSKEWQALEDQIKSMNEMHKEELELAASVSKEEADLLKQKIIELETKSSGNITEDSAKKMKSDFENTLKEVEAKAAADRERFVAEIKSLKEEKESAIQEVRKFESQIVDIQEQNALKVEKAKEEYDRQIREVKAEHGSESDELLAQLDLIEAETTQRFKNAEAAVKEKDAVIAALGSQLAESESRSAAMNKEYETLKEVLESLRSDLEVVSSSNDARENEIASLIERHSKEMDNEIASREKACEEAREEMIALAEKQLDERQEYYQALKRELDNALSKISVLERDLRLATKESEESRRRHEAREADIRDELAQSKAAIAAKQASLIRAEKVHQAELDRAREAESILKAKFEESQATSQSVQKALAKLVTEKQTLERELSDVTAISEELATICEKNNLM